MNTIGIKPYILKTKTGEEIDLTCNIQTYEEETYCSIKRKRTQKKEIHTFYEE